MTAQEGERLLYKGAEVRMAAEPLNQYLQNRNDLEFLPFSTSCWRGYYGQWEITDNKLYLIGLNAYIEGDKEVGLNYLFPGQNKVFANWYSGEIRIPQGEMLKYVHIEILEGGHMGYASFFEKYLILKLNKGIITESKLIDNRKVEPPFE